VRPCPPSSIPPSGPVGNSPCGVWPSFRRCQGCIRSGWCHRLVVLHASTLTETDFQLVPASLSLFFSLSFRAPRACSFLPPPVQSTPPSLTTRTRGGSCQSPRPRVQESPVAVTRKPPVVSQRPSGLRLPLPPPAGCPSPQTTAPVLCTPPPGRRDCSLIDSTQTESSDSHPNIP